MIFSTLSLLLLLCSLVYQTKATKGTDVSQFTSKESYECLASAGYEFTVARAYRESSGGTVDPNAVSTIANAWAGGMRYVDAYVYPHHPGDSSTSKTPEQQIQETYNNLKGSKYGMMWLDIEGTWSSDTSENVKFIQGMVNEALALNVTLGIYTSKHYWVPITGDSTAFSNYPLWYPHYENTPNPSFSDFEPFGGWNTPTIKQYKGTTSMCSASVDVNWYPSKVGDIASSKCCFCSNGGDGSGGCLPVADCEAKDSYECSKVDQCGDFNEEKGECT